MTTVLDVSREPPVLTLEECDQILFRRVLTKFNRHRLRRLGRYPQVLKDGHRRYVTRQSVDAYLASLEPVEPQQLTPEQRKAIGKRLVEGRQRKRAERAAAAAADERIEQLLS
jgi:hypothetical protein